MIDHHIYNTKTEEEIKCVFDDNYEIILLYFFLNTYVVGAH